MLIFSFCVGIRSFGVLLHEIFHHGETPYHNMSNEQVIIKVFLLTHTHARTHIYIYIYLAFCIFAWIHESQSHFAFYCPFMTFIAQSIVHKLGT